MSAIVIILVVGAFVKRSGGYRGGKQSATKGLLAGLPRHFSKHYSAVVGRRAFALDLNAGQVFLDNGVYSRVYQLSAIDRVHLEWAVRDRKGVGLEGCLEVNTTDHAHYTFAYPLSSSDYETANEAYMRLNFVTKRPASVVG